MFEIINLSNVVVINTLQLFNFTMDKLQCFTSLQSESVEIKHIRNSILHHPSLLWYPDPW